MIDDNEYQPIVGNGWSAPRTRAEEELMRRTGKGWLREGVEGWWRIRSGQSQ